MSGSPILTPIAVVLVTVGANCQTPDSKPAASAPTPRVKIIPWVECNWPRARLNRDDPRSSVTIDHVVEGLLIWRQVTDTAIVSTMPNRASIYRDLRRRVPGMRIIPGLKTKRLLNRFDSVSGWRAVSREVTAIRATSGERAILLDNETALEPHFAGRQSLDLGQLRKALALLPDDLECLWYPSIVDPSADEGRRRQRSAAVCKAVEEVLANVRFFDLRYTGHKAVSNRKKIAAAQLLNAIASRPTLPMQFFYGTEHKWIWWRDDQVHEALSYVHRDWGDGAEVIIYPGQQRWVEAARSLSERLLSASTAPKP